jgi:predicted RNA binding protein YcfA (HicA-like mRNA interferase family)
MPLTGKDILDLAIQAGWIKIRQNGSHHIVEKEGHHTVSIPVHGNKDLGKGLEYKLLKDLGLRGKIK